MAHVYLLDYGLSLLLGPKLQGAEDSSLFTAASRAPILVVGGEPMCQMNQRVACVPSLEINRRQARGFSAEILK